MKQLTPTQIRKFQKVVYDYYAAHGRDDLPWRKKVTPYTTFVSEVMLQQTQVPRVIEKFKEWMRAFPSLKKLAAAELKDVLVVWAGMGYNRRAKFLHEAAKKIVAEHGGRVPRDPAELVQLPGIGPNTAASIAAFGFGEPTVFIETNIRAVIIHHFFADRTDVGDDEILPLVEATLDRKHPHRWYSAIMDYGTFLKATQPNPSRKSRHHVRQAKFEGSNRQVRGAVLRTLAGGDRLSLEDLVTQTKFPTERVQPAADGLVAEGLIQLDRRKYFV